MFDYKAKSEEAKAKFDAFKTLAENKRKSLDNFAQKLDGDTKDFIGKSGKSMQGFLDNTKKKIPNINNIFDKLIKDLEKILHVEPGDGKESPLKLITRESVNETTKSIKQVTIDNIKKVLYASDGNFGCGVTTAMPIDSVILKPEEFDFLGALKINPSTSMGTLVYEDTINRDKIKMNKSLYDNFDSGSSYTFTSNLNNDLFSLHWDSANQYYNLTGLKGINNTITIDQFITQYYETIEFPNPSDILKNALNIVLHGDGSQPNQYDINTNEIMRIISKIMSFCGTSNKTDQLQQTPKDQFEESEVDSDFYVNFDDLDGIDLDDEAYRYKRVLKFTDCNNFEVPVNPNHIQDFAYHSKKDPLNAFNTALNKVAKDANAMSEGSIPLVNFNLSINMMAIMALPKAMLMTIFSPKIFLPFVILWKALKAGVGSVLTTAKNLIKYFSKVIVGILHDLFFKFINIFWGKAKPLLLALITSFIPRIIKSSKKRYINIIKGLLRLLSLLIPFIGISNCSDLYDAILKLFDLLKVGVPQKINGILLQAAQFSPGKSMERSLVNQANNLQKIGIETGLKHGIQTNVLPFLDAAFQGYQDEMDENSFVQISLSPASIPVAPGGGAALIHPLLKGYGKVM